MKNSKKSSRKHIGIKDHGLLSGLEKKADDVQLDTQLPFIGDSKVREPQALPVEKPWTAGQHGTPNKPGLTAMQPAVSATRSAKHKFTYLLSSETMNNFDDYVWRTRGNKSKIIERLVEEFLQKVAVSAGEGKKEIKKLKAASK